MRKAVMFDEFSENCPFFHYTDESGRYGCNHSNAGEKDEKGGLCYCFSCPLGIEAEQQDLTAPTHPDAVQDEIDWNGLCEDGEVAEGEILLLDADEDAPDDVKKALGSYENYLNRYSN